MLIIVTATQIQKHQKEKYQNAFMYLSTDCYESHMMNATDTGNKPISQPTKKYHSREKSKSNQIVATVHAIP